MKKDKLIPGYCFSSEEIDGAYYLESKQEDDMDYHTHMYDERGNYISGSGCWLFQVPSKDNYYLSDKYGNELSKEEIDKANLDLKYKQDAYHINNKRNCISEMERRHNMELDMAKKELYLHLKEIEKNLRQGAIYTVKIVPSWITGVHYLESFKHINEDGTFSVIIKGRGLYSDSLIKEINCITK